MSIVGMSAQRESHDLSDVEWRQMRRQLPCLQFEPVPETPPLLPRSLYAEPSEPTERMDSAPPPPHMRAPSLHVHFADDPNPRASPIAAGAPLSISQLAMPDPSHAAVLISREADPGDAVLLAETTPLPPSQASSAATSGPGELHAPVEAIAVHTLELEDLATAITATHEETKRSILAAVSVATSKVQRQAELERRKLEATHANRIAMLETRIQELEASSTEREQRESRAADVVERLSLLMGHWKRRQRALWESEFSLHACFAAWKHWRLHKKEKQTQQHFARQHMRKQSQQLLLQQWKLMTLQSRSEKELQSLREEQKEAMDRTSRELNATIEQLQQELDATRQELSVAQRGRRQVENDLRQVFLRGVSAMNIEALTLLKATQPERLTNEAELADVIRDDANSRIETKPTVSLEHSDNLQVADPGEEEELPSHERMIPMRAPADSGEIHSKLQAMLPPKQTEVSQIKTDKEPEADPNRSRLTRSTSAMAALFGHTRDHQSAAPPPKAAPPPPTAAVHGLRSAELVEAHQRMAHVTVSTPSSMPSSTKQASLSVPSPALQRAKTQSSTKFQVEMEYIKSSVEAAAYSGRLAPKARGGSPIDLDAYDEYIADTRRKTAPRPQSARPFRPYPTESPQFYMVNANNPTAPVEGSAPTCAPQEVPELGPRGRPKRPMSARPSSGVSVRAPKAPQSARPSNGVRRRRQEDIAADDAISARVRAVYCDVGRRGTPLRSLAPSATTASLLSSRARLASPPSEMQDECLKLNDVVTSLRAALRHEQAARLKAMARVRRLEEIVTMKDRKIEALMQGNAVTATAATMAAMREDSGKFGYAAAAAFAQRELAQRDRQHHVLVQKLRQKLAEQTQLVATYEAEMQTLRCSLKSSALMQLETECEELQLEVRRLQGIIAAQQHELALQAQQVHDAMDADARAQQQLARMHEEHKRLVHDKRRLEQDVVLLRAHVDQLERRVCLEQRKRTYDQGFHTGTRGPKSPRSPSVCPTPPSGGPVGSLAEALAELRSTPKESPRVASERRPTPALPHRPATGERSGRPVGRRRSAGEAPRELDVLAEEKATEDDDEKEDDDRGIAPAEPPATVTKPMGTRCAEDKCSGDASPRPLERDQSSSSVGTTPTESTRSSVSGSTTAASSSSSSTSGSTASLPLIESPAAVLDAAAAAMTQELHALGLLGAHDRQESWMSSELNDDEDEEEDEDDGKSDTLAYELDFMDT
ncbi:hypothetical protein ATCC90586_003222 [Pythium insidiosum]|nr:hypothetical protein ATCC90586_003222 [Pythium insidiosum]